MFPQDLLDLHAGEKMSQEERIRLTALRVGLNTPELYDTGSGGVGEEETPRPQAA